MKKLTWILILVFVASLLWWGFAISQEKPKVVAKSTASEKADTTKAKEHAYVGVGKCGCHKMKTWGNILEKWAATKHAGAYTRLAGEKAKAVAKDLKIENPQKSDKCLVCHVTGHEASAKLKGEKYSVEEGVTCEACHGPAGDYLKSHSKKDNAKQAAADGLMKPAEEGCVKCHNEKSPTYKEFKFKEAIKLVEHHKPTKEELEKAKKAEGK
ncbi:MAG: cytochrome C554 [Candidatus Zixiibacteriota bacterium]|nr:MAG: cytochrome C554 [candidate division Zixibacteria bacterium]